MPINNVSTLDAEHQKQFSALPRINEKAPDFNAVTCDGSRKLSDYDGKWLVLFSHPADFTPVCTTEVMAFAVNAEKFKALNCELLGLSVDSHFAHIAWKRNIQEQFGIPIPFPIIADVNMKVSMDYGMIHPGEGDTTPVRAVFVIDPNSVVRAMLYYPKSNGRSISELLRLLTAMQVYDEHGVDTPEGWKPGDNVIVSPPVTAGAADRRKKMALQDPTYHFTEWYYCERNLPVADINASGDVDTKIPA